MKSTKSSLDNSSESLLSNGNDGIIQFKIVYWGPGESGKTTNFMRLKEKFHHTKLTAGYSIETSEGRTLWQDSVFLSFNFNINEKKYHIIAQIVTCTGQERFLSTREYVLDGADGIIFIADSHRDMDEQNKRSFRELLNFTQRKKVPYVVQLNKRDIDNPISIDQFKNLLGLPKEEKYPDGSYVIYPAVALQGKNVVECFQDLIIQVVLDYFNL
jgi:signal recognition particle receptor subunit beta